MYLRYTAPARVEVRNHEITVEGIEGHLFSSFREGPRPMSLTNKLDALEFLFS